ncbi:MAG TPA: FhaA domain-containing protein [Blastocatellia bacterium]|nr:FhaA domain-containing protein [Blastocatellia bacterium]
MAGAKDSPLDMAEKLARRILERLGAKVDSKLGSGDQRALSTAVIGNLASRIEQTIESELKRDEQGTRRVAPNHIDVLFTYEESVELTPQYFDALGKELTASAFEFINNRRYTTLGPVVVKAGQDLFAKATTVKATFDGDLKQKKADPPITPAPRVEDSKTVRFTTVEGRGYVVELKPDGAPAYIGRAVENAVRLDDASVSRLHCSVALWASGVVMIADLGSANGTFVNEQPLGRDEARQLNPGDAIRVGDLKLTVSDIC